MFKLRHLGSLLFVALVLTPVLASAQPPAATAERRAALPPPAPDAPPPTNPSGTPASPEAIPTAAAASGPNQLKKALKKACDGCATGACSKAAKDACEAFKKETAPATGPSEKSPAAPTPEDCTNPASACYPSYWRRKGIDPHAIAADGKNASAEDLRAELGKSTPRTGEEILVAVVGGLQDFLEERAKAEALGYTVEQLKGRLCDEHAAYFVDTCKLLDQDDLALDQATLTRLRKAASKDLARLPSLLMASLPATNDPGELAVRAFAGGTGEAVVELTTRRVPTRDLPKLWAEKNKAAYEAIPAATRLACSLRSGTSMNRACLLFVLPELGSSASSLETTSPTPEQLAAIVEAAANSFCATYGPAGQRENGDCLLVPPDDLELAKRAAAERERIQFVIDDVIDDVKELARVSVRFVELAKHVEALEKRGLNVAEIAEALLPELADAFDDWRQALEKVVPQADKTPWLGRTSVTLRASAAAASRDYSELLAVIAESLEKDQPFQKVRLPKEVMAGIGFSARLAAAKKPEDAKKVFEEEAAPLGTYKLKFEREGALTFTVNAFVGTFVGYGKKYAVRDDSEPGVVTRPVTAPLGLDLTLFHSKKNHFGFIVPVIDPFGAGTIDSDSKAEEFDWGAVLTPGLLLRWGIQGSPFALLGGVVGQPLARSSTNCVNGAGESTPCWKGALQVGAALAVDVPLLVVH